MSIALVLAVAMLAAQSPVSNASAPVPWIVVDQPKPSRYDLLWNPSILIGSGGTLTAAVEHQGHYSAQIGTYIYRSADRGATWKRMAHLSSPRRASLFEAGGKLHLIGVDGSGRGTSGHPILRTSTDAGRTWSDVELGSPGWLLGEPFTQLDSGPVSAVIAAGRVWRPFVREHRVLLVGSALAGTDLSNAENWTWSSEVEVEKTRGWDDSVLLPGEPSSPPLLVGRRTLKPPRFVATLSADGRRLERRAEPPAVALPELAAGYSLPRDPIDGSIVSLTRSETIETEGGWREISLPISSDLTSQENKSILLRELRPMEQAVLFGWAGWSIDGQDLVVVLCARVPEAGDGERPPSRRRVLLFLRVPKFRERTQADPPLWEGR